MISRYIRAYLRHIRNKILYPGVEIGFDTMIDRNSNICKGSGIGSDSLVQSSDIEQEVVIGRKCRVVNSKVFRDTSIGDECDLYQVRMENVSKIYPRCRLGDASIGSYSFVGENSILSLVDIGKFCSIGPQVMCGYGDHPTDFVSTSPAFYSTGMQCGSTFAEFDCFQERKKISIGNDVWIGARVFIKDGVYIGDGAIVGAGAIVVKDVPDYAIVVGVPAKVVRYRFANELIDELKLIRWWDWENEELQMAHTAIGSANVQDFLTRFHR